MSIVPVSFSYCYIRKPVMYSIRMQQAFPQDSVLFCKYGAFSVLIIL